MSPVIPPAPNAPKKGRPAKRTYSQMTGKKLFHIEDPISSSSEGTVILDDSDIGPEDVKPDYFNLLVYNEETKDFDLTHIKWKDIWYPYFNEKDILKFMPKYLGLPFQKAWCSELGTISVKYAPQKFVWNCTHCKTQWVGDRFGPCQFSFNSGGGCHGNFECCINCFEDEKYCQAICECKNSGEHEEITRYIKKHPSKGILKIKDSLDDNLAAGSALVLSTHKLVNDSLQAFNLFLNNHMRTNKEYENRMKELTSSLKKIDCDIAQLRYVLENDVPLDLACLETLV